MPEIDRKYAAFDLETDQLLPWTGDRWEQVETFGIACAALAFEGGPETETWRGAPRVDTPDASEIVKRLGEAVKAGYTLVTWNGTAFDFRLLARESGMWEACARLAADHVDLMLMFTFKAGHFLGLDKALLGAGLAGKKREVTLKDGSVLTAMDGKKAPALWAQGEYEAVLSYLIADVEQGLLLARAIEKQKKISWRSSRGGSRFVHFNRLYTVRESFAFPEAYTGWVQKRPKRDDFVGWIPAGVLS